MSIILALLAALGFGAADFIAGLTSRKLDFRIVTCIVQGLGLVAAILAVLLFPGDGLSDQVLFWGAIAGLGTGAAGLLLFHGLSVARMSAVATLSALTGSVLPVLFGIAQGDSISVLSAIGIILALPAIALVSWQPGLEEEEHTEAPGVASGNGALWGLLAGIAIALFYIAFEKTGNEAGAWPGAVNQGVALIIVAPLALYVLVTRRPRLVRPVINLALLAGVTLGLTTLALLAAFSGGELAIVAVLSSLYPGVTTLLARFVLHEHWVRTQQLGLVAALVAVVLVSVGSS